MDKLKIDSIDHWVEVVDKHQLYLQELPAADAGHGWAILLLHGVFSNGRFFFNARQQGAARYFHDQGYRVFIGNLRGHGRSRWPAQTAKHWDWSFDTYVEQDIPALLRFVQARHDGPIYVLAHSFAGYALLVALGLSPDLQTRLAGLVLLAAAVNDYSDGGLGKRVQLPLASLVAQVYGRMPAKRLKLGPDDEPKALMRQFARWARQGHFRSLDGHIDYWRSLAAVTLPVYAAVGANDAYHASPARAKKLIKHLSSQDICFRVFGQKQGDGHDFSHYDIASGPAADRVIFPAVNAWITRHAA